MTSLCLVSLLTFGYIILTRACKVGRDKSAIELGKMSLSGSRRYCTEVQNLKKWNGNL